MDSSSGGSSRARGAGTRSFIGNNMGGTWEVDKHGATRASRAKVRAVLGDAAVNALKKDGAVRGLEALDRVGLRRRSQR